MMMVGDHMNINFMFIRKYEENREIALHSHTVHEFVYYFHGKGSSFCGGNNYTFDNDSFTIIPPNVLHDEKHIGVSHVLAVGFTIDNPDLSVNVAMYNGFHQNIFPLVDKIRTELINKNILYQMIIESILREIILYIIRDQQKKLDYTHERNDIIANSISFLNEYFMSNIDLNELSNSSGYSNDHFRILFKKTTGLTPKQYVIARKISYAKKLLEDDNLQLTVVATNCGFEYYSAFSLFFKKETGYSPYKYRLIHQKFNR